jgi:hypothetical protein
VLVLSGIKLVGVPQASLVIAVALAIGGLALVAYAFRQFLSRTPAPAAD